MEEQKKKRRSKRFYTIAEIQNYILIGVASLLVIGAIASSLFFLGQYKFSFLAFLKGEDGKQQISTSYQDTEHNLVDKSNLLIIGQADGSGPVRYYTLIQVNMEMGTLGICSLPTTIKMGEQSLTAVFQKSGGAGAKEALATYLGIRIDRYMTIKDSNYKKIISKLGEPTYSFAEKIKFSTSGEDAFALRIPAGEQELDGGQLLKLFRYSGEHLKDFKLQNELIAAAINGLLNEENYLKSEALFNALINYMDTDVVIADYTDKKEALEVLCTPGYSLSSQFIPTEGTYGSDGSFVMGGDMLQAVKTQYYKER